MTSPTAPDRSAAIAVAAQARMVSKATSNTLDEAPHDELEYKLQVLRIIDNNIRKNNNYETAARCLRLLHTLINNIVQNPQEAKFRSFKPTQPKIARDIFSVPGGPELLIEAGFRKKVVSFVESWSLPEPVAQSQSAPEISAAILRRLQIVEGALRSSAENAEIQHERADLHRQAEAEAEKNRKARVIEEIREDRARRAERDARERTSRARREAAAAAAVAAAAAAGPEAEVTASGIASLSRTASQALPRTRVERQASDDLDTDGDDDYEDEDEDDEMGKPRLFGGRGNVLGGS